MKPLLSMRRALEDKNLLGRELSAPSFMPMRSIIIAGMGESLTDEERSHYQKLTKRDREPLQRAKRVVVVAGRRSSKSKCAAALAIYHAVLCDHRENLSVGETGVVLCIAKDTEQASIVFNYAVGLIESQPVLKKEVLNITRDCIVFKNRIEIRVKPSSFRGLRGFSCVCCIADELCFFFTQDSGSVNCDKEIIDAIQPALLTTKGTLCIISSPYSKRGVAYDLWSKFYGVDNPHTLVAQGGTLDFNPTIDPKEIQEKLDEDYEVNSAEYLGMWRTDLSQFVSYDAVKSCVVGESEIAPVLGHSYCCFIDAATGSGKDSFACCIGHIDNEIIVADAIRNWKPPFSPDAVVSEIAALCKRYFIMQVYSDNFAGGFVGELLNKNNLAHEIITTSKSQMYIGLLGPINSKTIRLLNDDLSVKQLCNLERRCGFAGHDRIDAPGGMPEDSANVIAGMAHVCHTGGNLNIAIYCKAFLDDAQYKFYQERGQLP